MKDRFDVVKSFFQSTLQKWHSSSEDFMYQIYHGHNNIDYQQGLCLGHYENEESLKKEEEQGEKGYREMRFQIS